MPDQKNRPMIISILNFSTCLIIVLTFAISTVYGYSKFALINNSTLADSGNTIPGAYGDGIHYDTKAIQAAIDSVSNIGGGIVHFSNGKYLSAPFVLKSNVTLQIDSSATILASQNEHDYYQPGADTTKPPTSLQNFISANHAVNIKITGGGTIDGQGQPWWDSVNVAKAKNATLPLRPRLIEIDHSQHILVDSVTLINSPMFHLCPNYCYDVNVNHITIVAPSNSPNTDGIDPGECHHVRISYCKIDNGDDNIAVGSSSTDPSWPDAASSDIIIKHCIFLNGHGCSIGSYTVGGVDSMLVDSCSFNGTTNGIRIKSERGRGGNIRGLTYSNITMIGVKYPIWIASYYPDIPGPSDPAQTVNLATPYYHDINIVNLISTNSPYIGYVVGLPEKFLNRINFQNTSFSSTTGLVIRNADIDTTNMFFNIKSGPGLIFQVDGKITGISPEDKVDNINFNLMQNYPNPFNPSTIIKYQIPNGSFVRLKIYDVLGRELETLVNGWQEAGNHSVVFNSEQIAGKKTISSGIYLYKLQAGNYMLTKKMILIK